MDSLDTPALLISNPFVNMAIRFPLVIVGVLALALAGRAPAMRGLIRTGGGLLILNWILGVAFSVTLEVASLDSVGPGLFIGFDVVSIIVFAAALILLLIALAGSGRGSAQRGAATPQPAGPGGWPPPGGPGAGQYAQSPGPGWGPAGPGTAQHGPQAGPYGQPSAHGGPVGPQYDPNAGQHYGGPSGGQQPSTGPQHRPSGPQPGAHEQPGRPPAGPPQAEDPRY
ncbi:hypothetical protein [Streptomonospora wellingtoniae]|uniref:Uncharacterized protein n=1 Tax=Streptomonospora wellingtoniae TaxID=3075544 RepID=A0ABU2KYK7_9ACTN|nr:hypothetical protein [Streptomonospora sp. DSM 45055]MDT0304399.1 hypothetical protein [Streptomonospora sp. DSM 45055]